MNSQNVKLTQKKCKACNAETPPLKGEELMHFFDRLDDGWDLVDDHHIQKTYRFKDFRRALEFTNRIGEMSEEEGHHPEITLSWGKAKTKLYTHAIDALSENDFIWAAKADEIYQYYSGNEA